MLKVFISFIALAGLSLSLQAQEVGNVYSIAIVKNTQEATAFIKKYESLNLLSEDCKEGTCKEGIHIITNCIAKSDQPQVEAIMQKKQLSFFKLRRQCATNINGYKVFNASTMETKVINDKDLTLEDGLKQEKPIKVVVKQLDELKANIKEDSENGAALSSFLRESNERIEQKQAK